MKRITLVANELRGFYPAGGMGTATTHLALALARMGHDVDILIGYYHDAADVDPEWGELYRRAGVRLRSVRPRDEAVAPPHFAVARKVELELREDPPDVVIVHDLGGPAYSALRLAQTGVAFADTLFVVYCHGARRYVMELSGAVGVKDLRPLLEMAVHEQGSVELADVVVSPSRFLLEWMRADGWRLPERAYAIPYFTRAGALGEAVPEPHAPGRGERVRRLAFFGRLDERKGLKLFAAALDALEPELLEGVEIELVGKASRTWPPERVEGLFSRPVSLLTDLDQPAALARLSRPGTLVVMPSLGETFSNAVYECLECSIPFIASGVGGVPELVAEADRPRVLFEPTAAGVEAALRGALTSGNALRPARAALTNDTAYERWAEVLEEKPRRPSGTVTPDTGVEQLLAQAQTATGADVVTCGVRLQGEGGDVLHFFSGEPGGLGVLANDYGTVALFPDGTIDNAEWAELARLTAAGKRIVSVPLPLVTRSEHPAKLEDAPGEALRVVQELETALPPPMRSLARLAAGLAAASPLPNGAPPRRRLRAMLGSLWRRSLHLASRR